MPARFDRNAVRSHLEHFAFQSLFIEELGWDHGGIDLEVLVRGRTFALHAIAHKRGLVAYQCVAASDDTFPDHPTRQKRMVRLADAEPDDVHLLHPEARLP